MILLPGGGSTRFEVPPSPRTGSRFPAIFGHMKDGPTNRRKPRRCMSSMHSSTQSPPRRPSIDVGSACLASLPSVELRIKHRMCTILDQGMYCRLLEIQAIVCNIPIFVRGVQQNSSYGSQWDPDHELDRGAWHLLERVSYAE